MAFYANPFGRGAQCILRRFTSGTQKMQSLGKTLNSFNNHRQRQETRGEEEFQFRHDAQRAKQGREVQVQNRKRSGLQAKAKLTEVTFRLFAKPRTILIETLGK